MLHITHSGFLHLPFSIGGNSTRVEWRLFASQGLFTTLLIGHTRGSLNPATAVTKPTLAQHSAGAVGALVKKVFVEY